MSSSDDKPVQEAIKNLFAKVKGWIPAIKKAKEDKKAKDDKDDKDRIKNVRSIKLQDRFPTGIDTPEVRVEKFYNLIETWSPRSDFWVLVDGSSYLATFMGFVHLPGLMICRNMFRANQHPVISVFPVLGVAAFGSLAVMHNSIKQIIAALFPFFNAILTSTYISVHYDGLIVPVDVFKNWPAFKEGAKIVFQTAFRKKLMLSWAITSVICVASGAGCTYFAMKQYHDLHKHVLLEHQRELVL